MYGFARPIAVGSRQVTELRLDASRTVLARRVVNLQMVYDRLNVPSLTSCRFRSNDVNGREHP